jgi:hypothetical protein
LIAALPPRGDDLNDAIDVPGDGAAERWQDRYDTLYNRIAFLQVALKAVASTSGERADANSLSETPWLHGMYRGMRSALDLAADHLNDVLVETEQGGDDDSDDD